MSRVVIQLLLLSDKDQYVVCEGLGDMSDVISKQLRIACRCLFVRATT